MAKDYDDKMFTTTLDKDVTFDGCLTGAGNVRIEGHMIGTINIDGDVVIGKTGSVKVDNIKANNALVAGRLDGNIELRGKLELSETGVVVGNINSKLLYLEEGAKISGTIDMLKEEDEKVLGNKDGETAQVYKFQDELE